MDAFESRYVEVKVNPERAAAARALKPIHEHQTLGRTTFLFDGVDRQQLTTLGEARTPTIADVFVAVIGNHTGAPAPSPAESEGVSQ